MKAKELRDMILTDLERKEKELRQQLLNLRIQKASQQLKNPLKIREIKREIARVLTIIREKKYESRKN
ncbi:MAG: 50S ribosomal protein L29 [Candidatus Margulisiibacteriota bacterium]